MSNFDGKTDDHQQNMRPSFEGFKADLVTMIESRINSRKIPTPEQMPKIAFEASTWFIRLFEGQKSNEAVREVSTKHGKKYWVWPYAERVKFLMKLFFKSSPELQEVVIAARTDKIFWRGYDLKTFMMIIDETEGLQRLGLVGYMNESRPRRTAQIKQIPEETNYQDIEANRQKAVEYTGVEA